MKSLFTSVDIVIRYENLQEVWHFIEERNTQKSTKVTKQIMRKWQEKSFHHHCWKIWFMKSWVNCQKMNFTLQKCKRHLKIVPKSKYHIFMSHTKGALNVWQEWPGKFLWKILFISAITSWDTLKQNFSWEFMQSYSFTSWRWATSIFKTKFQSKSCRDFFERCRAWSS